MSGTLWIVLGVIVVALVFIGLFISKYRRGWDG